MKTKQEILDGLAQCYGTEGYHYNGMFGKNYVYTDGFRYLMLSADAVWLMQAIFSHRRKEDFQVWKLKVNEDRSAVLTMKEDTDCPNIVEQKIPWTDFPLDEIELWAVNDHNCNGEWGPVHVVLMLKSEY